MASERLVRWRKTLWVVLASLVVHVLVVALFFLPDAVKMPEPAKEDTVSVELVPPPEEPKPPEPKPPAEKPPEPLKMPEPEKPPEPAKPAEPAKAEQPPAPPEPPPPPPPPPPAEKAARGKPAPPPPPPPPPLPAEKAPEEKPPPPEQKPPEEPPKAEPPARQSQVRALDGAFRYGDKDAGPKKSEDGSSAEGDTKPATPDEAAKADATNVKPDAAAAQTPDDAENPETPPEAPPSDQPPAAKPPSETPLADTSPMDPPAGAGPLPPQIDLPQVDVPNNSAEKNGPPSNSPDSAKVELAPAPPSDLPKGKPAPPKPGGNPKQAGLTKAKTLFSRSETGDAIATQSTSGMPRSARFTRLCASELTSQIGHALQLLGTPVVWTYRAIASNVLEVSSSPVLGDGKAYDVSFRCEVDDDATQVVNFAFRINGIIPRSQWKTRRVPGA
ncbi:DUF930 domain-containing protein [Rhizobium sp. L51/94]|uniref:DUF930 domain-containing protein n=1 Tax=Rhizobium sp. L51/94 TaxID=2819999 RepID=UPI001C5AFB37|nr:DUF930 domain-containing protein [Rhizobium sp. L51/94]QXZ77996.1 DUF930 domain-containing protein [Rhizobium sp. L51/94]